jgi:hypothetical protein
MEYEGSQEPAACPRAEAECSPRPASIDAQILGQVSSLQAYQHNICTHVSCFQRVLHDPLVASCLT